MVPGARTTPQQHTRLGWMGRGSRRTRGYEGGREKPLDLRLGRRAVSVQTLRKGPEGGGQGWELCQL